MKYSQNNNLLEIFNDWTEADESPQCVKLFAVSEILKFDQKYDFFPDRYQCEIPWRLLSGSSDDARKGLLNNNRDNQDDYVKMSAKLVWNKAKVNIC